MAGVDLKKRSGRSALDLAQAGLAWLKAVSPEFTVDTEQLRARFADGAGAANVTVLVQARVRNEITGREFNGLALRLRDGEDSPFQGTSLTQQALLMEWVRTHSELPVPQTLAVDSSGAAVGVEMSFSEQLTGWTPADFPPYNASGPLHNLEEAQRGLVWQSGVSTMAGVCLVPLPPAESGIILRELFEEVAYWSDTLAWVKRDFSMGMEIQDPIRTLSESIPDTQPGLSWGDARFANQIFCNVDCVGLLDWEMASAGGGLLDLAWWLMFDVNHSVDMDLPRLAGLGGVEATVALWQRKTGLSAQHLDWFARFSLVRLAIIRCALYGVRKRMGLPVPNSDDPRSVEKLLARLDKLNYR